MNSKVCTSCKTEKSIGEFHTRPDGKLGVRADCKECLSVKRKIRYQKTKESTLKRNADYYLANRGKVNIKKRETGKKYRELHKDERRKKNLEYYYANRNSCLTRSKEHYEENSQERLKRCREYYVENKERILVRCKEYYKNNKATKNKYSSRRRVERLKADVPWANLEKIADIYRDRQLLSEMTGVLHHVDHIIPLQGKLVSGLHVEYNLRIIPASENLSKNNQFLEELL